MTGPIDPEDRPTGIVEVSGDGRPLGPIGQRSNRAFAAAGGLIVVLGLVAFIGFINRSPARPAEPSAGLKATASSLAGTFPATAGGLPVIAVGTARNLAADPSNGAAELAVGGWYSAVRHIEACPSSGSPGGACPSGWSSVVESGPDVVWGTNGAPLPAPAGTVAIDPLFVDPVERPAIVGQELESVELVPPSPVVLLGHFHDDRIPDASAFVVDAVADQAGTIAAGSSVGVPSTELTSAAVSQLVRGHLKPTGVVLGFGALPWSGPAGEVATAAEPTAVEPSTDGPPADGRTVWLARGYLRGSSGPPQAAWLAIDDATYQVWGPLASQTVSTDLPPHIPVTIDGLPVRTVAAALPSAPGTSPLLAIGGYLSNDRAPDGCPPTPTTDKPDPCSGTELVLVDRPINVLQPNDATFLYAIAVPPGAASIRPVILPGTSVADPWAHALHADDRESPRPVVVVGRFGDPRSPDCAVQPGGGSAACDRSFVVDQLAWIDGVSQGPSVYLGAGPKPARTIKAVTAAVAGWFLPALQPAIVSITSTTPADSVALTGLTLAGPSTERFWLVRVVTSLPDGPASSILVFDDRTLSLIGVTP